MQRGLESLAGTGSRIAAERIQEKPLAGSATGSATGGATGGAAGGAGSGKLDFAAADKIATSRVGTTSTTYVPGHLGEVTGGRGGIKEIKHIVSPRMIQNLEERLRTPSPGLRMYNIDRYEVLKGRKDNSQEDTDRYYDYVKNACRNLDIRK